VTDLEYDAEEMVDERELRRHLDRSRRRRVVVLVLLLVVVPIGVVVAASTWVWWQLDPPGKPGATVQVEVTKGWGVPEIGDELSSRGVIGSSLVFQTYSRLKGAGPFQAGTYPMHRDLGVRGAINVLEQGPVVKSVNLAVIPGKRLTEIAQAIDQQAPWLDGGKFLELAKSGAVRSRFQPASSKNLEGMLWPDTYRVSEDETERDLLKVMVSEFDKKAIADGLEGANVRGYGPYDVVKVASLIQSEAKVDKDRPLIASVIYNRLQRGMPLQIDATVLYATGKRSGITRADLEARSPYNTYKVKGLPPTPISGITDASLDAALHPATTDYLYYVIASKDGAHAFAKTYEEHQRNIDKARAAGLL
jgi:peptidoglycan lytic transglycosylase G